jgi:hypothetical protein
LVFSESVKNVIGNITVNAPASIVVESYLNGTVFKATITAPDFTIVKMVLGDAITDAAGNKLAPKTCTYTIGDFTKPTMTVTQEPTSPVANSFALKVLFNEAVTGVSTGISVINGTLGAVTANGNEYTVNVTAADLANVSVTFGPGITDLSGNSLASVTKAYTVGDFTKPTVVVTDPVAPIQTTFTVGLKFSETVTGVAGAVTATGGTVTVTGSGDTYVVTVVTPGSIDVVVTVGAGVKDASGNPLTAVSKIYKVGDFTAPTVSVDALTVNNVNGVVPVTSSEVGSVYLALSTVAANAADLSIAVAQGKAVMGTVTSGGVAVNLSTAGLVAGSYKAYGFDAVGNKGVAANVVTVKIVEMISIKAIQGETAVSPKVDQIVKTSGTVTAVKADGKGYWIQDANAAWSGIYVYDAAIIKSVQRGTAVVVLGTVTEYHGMTEITAISVEYGAPIVIAPVVLANPADANTEAYESVLVTIKGMGVKALKDTYKEWVVEKITPTAISVIVDNYLYEADPIKTNFYDITGIVNVYDSYKLAPRDVADVRILTDKVDIALNLKVYPNPFDKVLNIRVSNEVELTKAVITNIAGQVVKEVSYPGTTIQTSELRSGVYFISLHTVDGIAKTDRIIKR